MSKNNMFNQKLEQIGGENIVDGITLKSEDKEKILNFINANTNQNYILNDNKLEKEKNEQEIKNTLLDEEIDCAIKENRKILIALSENVENVIEMYISEDNTERLILIDKDFCEKDNLEDIALADRLTKALFITHENDGIALLSSTAVKAVIATSSNVYHGPDSSNYAKVGSIDAGEDPVYILATSMGWYHIEYLVTSTGKHKTGYIPASVVSSYSGGDLTEEDFYGGYCYATTELDVRTCDDFSLTAPVGTLFKHEGCTFLFSYEFNGKNIAFIEYATSSGTKRGYVYAQYLKFPFETIVCIVKEAINVYGGPGSNCAIIGALGAGELVSLLAKEGNEIYVEYNTKNGRKRGYIAWDKVDARDYTPGTLFPDFYTNGVNAHAIDENIIVYGGPNSNYAQLGSVKNEEVINFNTNKVNTDEYGFEYTCIEYTVTATGQRKRGYVLVSKIVNGNLPEENNPLESFNESYNHFGSKISYGQTQKGRNMFYYKFGNGANHLFLTFALHGWEDGTKSDGTYYHGDGNMLLKVAKRFMQDFNNLTTARLNQLKEKWSIYVFPGINLDGIVNGNNNNGFGRCLYNKLDPNRNWGGNFKANNPSVRYKTASSPFQAIELQNLRKALENNRGSGKNVLVDVHGWFNQTVGNSNIGQYYWNSMGIPSSRHSYGYGEGYLIAWAKNSPTLAQSNSNYPGIGADACLLELTPTTNYSDSNMQSYGDKFFNGTLSLLDNIEGTVGPVNKKDVNLPADKKASFKSETSAYITNNIGAASIKANRTPEEAVEDTLSYDSIFTNLSNKFGMRKALIQTVSMWERACEGKDDPIADARVRSYYAWEVQMETWYNLPDAIRLITPQPEFPLFSDADSSTGFSQIFAKTGINARNWAKENGYITDREYNLDNWKDMWEVWQKLNEDINFNLETCALVLLWEASNLGLERVNPYSYSQEQIKQILTRYNGAEEYGTKNIGLYNIIEKYNSQVR